MSTQLSVQGNRPPIRYILTSHSIDNLFDYCQRKFEFLNVYDRRPKRESGFAADVGTALHNGTQAWLIARAEGQSPEECEKRAFFELLKSYPWDDEVLQKTRRRSYDRTILALYKIIESKEWDDWELLYVKDKGWAIEIPWVIYHESVGEFLVKNTGERCKLATQGKIDFIMRHKRTGEYRTWDLKTTTTQEKLVRAEYTYSGQQVGYSSIMFAMLGITPEQFSVGYIVARFMTDDEADVQFLPFEKPADMIEDYWLTKLDRLYRMKNYAEQGWFPRTNGGCHAWNQECQFFEICQQRDAEFIERWFSAINAEPQQGYDYWVELTI